MSPNLSNLISQFFLPSKVLDNKVNRIVAMFTGTLYQVHSDDRAVHLQGLLVSEVIRQWYFLAIISTRVWASGFWEKETNLMLAKRLKVNIIFACVVTGGDIISNCHGVSKKLITVKFQLPLKLFLRNGKIGSKIE